ncbi:MAG TPA: IS701 family transposase [Micromonosporaceae bacterium]|nr:IS701 family transposase [Micromonosporaceae bacterium]
MELAEFERAADAFVAFHRRFAPLFGRAEARARGEQYLRGLLVQRADRRNAENLAEAVEGAAPRALQRFLTEAPWPTGPVIDRLQAEVAGRLEHPEAVLVLDETGFPKQGRKSVGVARQYSGTLGKVGNCQVGVFLAYASERGHALVDGALYLPRGWTDDPDRCRAAGVPDEVGFRSKPELGLELVRQARARGHLQARWVTADEAYGQVPEFRAGLDADGWWYVLEVPATTIVFPRPGPPAPAESGRIRRRTDLAAPRAVAALAEALPPERWQALAVADGAQGPRVYQFAGLRAREHHAGTPGRQTWVLFRRNPDGSELKVYLSNAPPGVPLLVLGRVGARRWAIETGFQTDKGQVGLDEYEVRGWAGWHHHVTLALLAGAFLLGLTQDWGGKHAAPDAPPGQPRPPRDPAAPIVDAARPAGLAGRHPSAQRPRQTLPCQTPPPQAA